MRRPIGLALFTAATLMASHPPEASAQAAPDLTGTWKVVVGLPFRDLEFLVFETSKTDGALKGTVTDGMIQPPTTVQVDKVDLQGDAITIGLKGGPMSGPFVGVLGRDGKALGTIRIQGQTFPARLEKAEAGAKVTRAAVDPAYQQKAQAFGLAMQSPDQSAKAKALAEMLEGATFGTVPVVRGEIMGALIAGGRPAAEVKTAAQAFLDAAKPFGPAYVVQSQGNIYQALDKAKSTYGELADEYKKIYAPAELKLALAGDRALSTDPAAGDAAKAAAASRVVVAATLAGDKEAAAEAEGRVKSLTLKVAREADKAAEGKPDEVRARAAEGLARAARTAGDAALADEAQARADTLNIALDEAYKQNVPPFKPEAFAGRKDKANDRVVLVELFTGAQCPPCVPTDVAFDALLDTYKPAELIALQYHLHIPGPDPLTNADAEARAQYYPEVRGTPSIFFNGKVPPGPPGGGRGMADSKPKYDQYRQGIDEVLEGKAQAAIDLKATKEGEAIKIVANAKAQATGPKQRLRFAIVEDVIRYVGGNGLRFHHKVVRGMPGGVEGLPMTEGAGQADLTVNLSDLRKGLDGYLSSYEGNRPFPNGRPSIDLKGLSVVAFVQDDNDRSILGAAIVPLDPPAAH